MDYEYNFRKADIYFYLELNKVNDSFAEDFLLKITPIKKILRKSISYEEMCNQFFQDTNSLLHNTPCTNTSYNNSDTTNSGANNSGANNSCANNSGANNSGANNSGANNSDTNNSTNNNSPEGNNSPNRLYSDSSTRLSSNGNNSPNRLNIKDNNSPEGNNSPNRLSPDSPHSPNKLSSFDDLYSITESNTTLKKTIDKTIKKLYINKKNSISCQDLELINKLSSNDITTLDNKSSNIILSKDQLTNEILDDFELLLYNKINIQSPVKTPKTYFNSPETRNSPIKSLSTKQLNKHKNRSSTHDVSLEQLNDDISKYKFLYYTDNSYKIPKYIKKLLDLIL